MINYPKNIIFVCVGNQNRSVTAEEYAKRNIIKKGYFETKIQSAGVATGICFERETIQFTEELGNNTDLIIAMDEFIELSLEQSFNQPKEKIIRLNIRDVYENDLESLVKELDKQLLPILDRYFPKK